MRRGHSAKEAVEVEAGAEAMEEEAAAVAGMAAGGAGAVATTAIVNSTLQGLPKIGRK